MPEVTCTYFPSCRGCDDWDKAYPQQTFNKLIRLQETLNLDESFITATNFLSAKEWGLRHRFDFTFEMGPEQKLGFYGQDRNLIDLDFCLQLSKDLQNIYEEFRSFKINSGATQITKGSIRLRVGPSGQKGCWLDFANIDIKNLLDDSVYLNQLLEAGFHVEIGQKSKTLRRVNGQLGLHDPEPKIWFRTKELDLKSYVRDFTQPSWLTANLMVDQVLSWIKDEEISSVIEFGPGIGQFTLPFLQRGHSVHAFENNLKAIEVLKLNAAEHGLQEKLTIHAGDFQIKPFASADQRFDLVFVNPPRSGLKNFVNTVIETKSPYCIYVSCFPESMKADIQHLKMAGYRIVDAKVVDQFPQTHHYEACVFLEKSNE